MSDIATFPDLRGRAVFITGGGSGIGAALTEGFLAQGALVAFIDLADSTPLVQDLGERYGTAPLFIQGDITDTDGLRAAVAQAAESHGPAAVLVNNAANDQRHAWQDVTPEEWDRHMAVNLKSYFFAIQAVAPAMIAAGRGAIVNFSSVSYMIGMTGMPAYTAANAGILALTRTMARELGPSGVRVNALAPGWVLTEKQKALWVTPEALADYMPRQALKESMVPDDIVAPVLFLASEASRMMTGQSISVDGGVVSVSA